MVIRLIVYIHVAAVPETKTIENIYKKSNPRKSPVETPKMRQYIEAEIL